MASDDEVKRGLVADRRDFDEKQRDRDLDLLKHVSTLDLAALILFLALVEPFRDLILAAGPAAASAAYTTIGALIALSLSLLVSVLGLILLTVVRPLFLVRVAVVIAYVLFGVGMAQAAWFAWAWLY